MKIDILYSKVHRTLYFQTPTINLEALRKVIDISKGTKAKNHVDKEDM